MANGSQGAIVGQWYIEDDLGLDAAPPYLGIVPNWTLQEPGAYDITLVASNDYACSDTAQGVFDVYVPAEAARGGVPRFGLCAPRGEFRGLECQLQP